MTVFFENVKGITYVGEGASVLIGIWEDDDTPWVGTLNQPVVYIDMDRESLSLAVQEGNLGIGTKRIATLNIRGLQLKDYTTKE